MGKLQNMMRVMRKHDIEDSKLVDVVLDMDDRTILHEVADKGKRAVNSAARSVERITSD